METIVPSLPGSPLSSLALENTVIALLFASLLPPLASVGFPQDTLKEDIAAYKKAVAARHREADVIAFIDGFVQVFQSGKVRLVEIADALEIEEGNASDLKKERTLIERQQGLLAKTVWKAFSRKNQTEKNQQIWTAAIYAFGQMGSFGPTYIWKAFEDKRFREDRDFQSLCVEQIGFTKDYTQAEELIDLLDYKHAVIAAKAADSLGQFREASVAVRKECVKKLVKLLESYRTTGVNDSDSPLDKINYRTIRGPFISALKGLTGQSISNSLDWTKWWNNNKNNSKVWKK